MTQRGELINALESRGFESKFLSYGWKFQHEDGFTIEFDANGKFILTLPDGEHTGVMTQPSDVLSIIDKVAEAL